MINCKCNYEQHSDLKIFHSCYACKLTEITQCNDIFFGITALHAEFFILVRRAQVLLFRYT